MASISDLPAGIPGLFTGTSLGGLVGPGRGDNEFRDVASAQALGIPGFETENQRRIRLAQEAARRQAAQLGAPSQFMGGQQRLAALLEARSRGEGPSMAGEQFRQGMQAGMAQQQALAATGRGNPALAARQASLGASGLATQLSGQASLGRIAEMQGAQGMLGQLLGQARGQDEERRALQLDADMRQRQLNDLLQSEALRQQVDILRGQQEGAIAREQARGGRFRDLMGIPTQDERALGLLQGGLQSALGGGGV